MAGLEGETYHGLKLLKLCGAGAYGEVYYCSDVAGRRLAVKIVSKSRLGEDWRRELRGVVNFQRVTGKEAVLLRIFHVEETDDGFFYTMEAADKLAGSDAYKPDTLAARLRSGPLPDDELFDVLYAIFSGIAAIHRAGLAHRDIKPDNILFVNGVPKIGDIGLVSSLSINATRPAGTLDFLPPEMRDSGADSSGQLCQKSDLYAFGKVIYCAITGQRPSNYPSIPETQPTSPALKLFMRLAMQLCDRDRYRRLEDVQKVGNELLRIRRMLLCGETFRDKLTYSLKCAARRARAATLNTGHWCVHHYATALLLAVCMAGLVGAAAWYFRPPPPFDVTKVRTKEYHDERKRIAMTIPVEWEVASPAQSRREFEQYGEEDLKRLPQELLDTIELELALGLDVIKISGLAGHSEKITVVFLAWVGEELWETDDEEIRIGMWEAMQRIYGEHTSVLGMERTEIGGNRCIVIDFFAPSMDRRLHFCAFPCRDGIVGITLHSPNEFFAERLEEFNSVLSTLKFL